MQTLIEGDASFWNGCADLILTNPYAVLPRCLDGVPAIISNFAEHKKTCEYYVGAELHEIGSWGNGLRNRIWVAHLPVKSVELADLVEEEFEPGRGWFPLELPMRLLQAYGQPGITVWDGFMGRGTVGKACQALGMDFIGIDRDPARVAIAKEYLGC